MYEILDYVQGTSHSEDDLSKGWVKVVHTALWGEGYSSQSPCGWMRESHRKWGQSGVPLDGFEPRGEYIKCVHRITFAFVLRRAKGIETEAGKTNQEAIVIIQERWWSLEWGHWEVVGF